MKLKKLLLTACWLVVLSVLVLAQAPKPEEVLDGLDPVLLIQGKEVQGELELTVTRGLFKYLFASATNKALFEKDPARYEIQLEGACARMGAPVRGNPNLFSVHQGRVYIFGSGDCKKLFDATPEKYLGKEGAATAPLNASAAAAEKGQALITKAVAALGGATNVDGLTSYHEKRTSWQARPNGMVEVQRDFLMVFPAHIRVEQVMPHFTKPDTLMQQLTVLTPGAAFGSAMGRVIELPPATRAAQEKELQHTPLHILRARTETGFKAVLTGAGKVGESAVDWVTVERSGFHYVLGVEGTTGRVLSLSYQRRGPQGSFGQFTQTFADFRPVAGLTLPFKITASFDGQPWNDYSAHLEEITLNAKVEPALFEKPKAEKPQ